MHEIDREISALEARVKLLRKQKVSIEEKQSIKWLAERETTAVLASSLRSLPKKIYCDLAGRARKTLDEQADEYNLPLRRPSIDLFETVRTLHDRLIDFAESARLAETSETVGLKDEKTRQEIRKIQTNIAIMQIDLSRKNSELIPREQVREALQWLSGQLLKLGTDLEREFGEKGRLKLNDFLSQLEFEIESGVLNL